MVTKLDIGYLKTAHPPNKQAVGHLLAGFALSSQYGRKYWHRVLCTKRLQAQETKIVVTFESVGSGLMAPAGGLDNFVIAGADKVYAEANATIVRDKVVASSPSTSSPIYIRYAWSDSSRATLYNKEGLPAATFASED